MSRAAVSLVFAIACSSKTEAPRAEPPAPPEVSASAPAVEEPAPEAAPEPPDQPPVRAPARPVGRAARPIEVVLRSSPPGASATVDGRLIGHTPTYWAGEADGREHEFTFALPGYAPARYRFVPITSGVVHARLEVLADEPEAGAPALFRAPTDAALPPPRAPPAPAEPPTLGAGPEP